MYIQDIVTKTEAAAADRLKRQHLRDYAAVLIVIEREADHICRAYRALVSSYPERLAAETKNRPSGTF